MKKLTLKISAIMLILSILLSFMVITGSAAPSTYSKESNSGTRNEVCTSLAGTSASSYYTGSNTYDNLSKQSGGSVLSALRTLMTSTHKKNSSYNDCKNMADETDCEKNGLKCVTIYTSFTSKYGSADINREHVWPKSLGGYETSGPGADLHHIRPSESNVNSNRGNLKYGNVTTSVKTSIGSNSGKVGGTYNGTYFEPNDNVKGDVARICLYMYVRYGGDSSYTCGSITKVFQSVEVLLEWCEMDPVDTWEMGRNEVIQAYQGNRNVFIDYPEYAWILFGKAVPTDMQTPSGKAMSGSTGGNTGDSGNTGDNGNTDDSGNTGDSACTHTTTEIRNVATATCAAAGYTGDKYCTSCGAKVMSGTSVAKLPHTNSDWIVDKTATATEAGSRHIECTVCHTVVKTEAILPTNSVSAFVMSVNLAKSSDKLLDRYTYIAMAIDAYYALDDSEIELVATQYSELTALINGYNAEAEEINDSHEKATTIILFITPDQISAAGYVVLPSKKYV